MQVNGGDHPREYGENIVKEVSEAFIPGSSPRIRGELPSRFRACASAGIIPANTGRMWLRLGCVRVIRDHPREYGENNYLHNPQIAGPGSSPRIRGEYVDKFIQDEIDRIIPANTGRIRRGSTPHQ